MRGDYLADGIILANLTIDSKRLHNKGFRP